MATFEEAQAALQATADITSVPTTGYATEEEAQAALQARLANPLIASGDMPPLPNETETVQERPSLGRRIGDSIQNRREEVTDTIEAFVDQEGQYIDIFGRSQGQTTVSQFVTQLAGKAIAAPVLDATADVVVAGASGAYMMLPEELRGEAEEYAGAAFNWVMESPVAEEALYYAQQGAEAYSGWKERNPNSARTLESIVNVGALLTPPIRPKPGVPSAPGSIPENVPLLVRGSHVFDNSARESNRKFVTEIMRPDKADVSPSQVTQSSAGTQRANLDAWQRETVEELLDLPMKPRETALVNWKIVQSKVDELNTGLLDDLADVSVDPDMVRRFVNNNIDEAVTGNVFISGNPAFQKIMTQVADKAQELFAASDGTAAGLLRARQQLDRWVKDQKGDRKAFNSPELTPLNEAVKVVRNALNESIEASAPATNVRGRLRQQSQLLGAMDNLADLTAAEAAGVVGRVMQGLKSGTGLHVSATPIGVAATAGLGASILGSGWIPYVAAPLALAAAGTLAYRGVMAPSTSRMLASMLRGLNTTIETVKDPIIRNMHIADRAVIIELLQNTEVGKEETGEQVQPQ